MSHIKLNITSKGAVSFYIEGREITAEGELTFEPPTFYVNKKTLNYSDLPNQNNRIADADINNLVFELNDKIINGTRIIFE